MSFARCVALFALAICLPLVLGSLGAAEVTTYSVRGVLRSFDAATHQATIAHEEIAGYMPAMTMPFDVRDPATIPPRCTPETS